MPKVCAHLARFFRIIPPPLHSHRAIATCKCSHPSSSMSALNRQGRNISTTRLSPANCFHWPRRCRTPGDYAFLVRNCSNCEKATTDKMACPVRDPASEQLNTYKKNLKVGSDFRDTRLLASKYARVFRFLTGMSQTGLRYTQLRFHSGSQVACSSNRTDYDDENDEETIEL